MWQNPLDKTFKITEFPLQKVVLVWLSRIINLQLNSPYSKSNNSRRSLELLRQCQYYSRSSQKQCYANRQCHIAFGLKPNSLSKLALCHKMSNQYALDKICFSLNSTQHCFSRLPPLATCLLKGCQYLVPFLYTCDLHVITCYQYYFLWIHELTESGQLKWHTCALQVYRMLTQSFTTLMNPSANRSNQSGLAKAIKDNKTAAKLTCTDLFELSRVFFIQTTACIWKFHWSQEFLTG